MTKAEQKSRGMGDAARRADFAAEIGAMPVKVSLMGKDIFDDGVGTVWVGRELPDGRLLVASFLVDVFCLGVKDVATFEPLTEGELEEILAFNIAETLVPRDACCMKKLILEAVAWAATSGFSPHPDYSLAKIVLEGVDIADCATEFRFGRDGKPFYFQGAAETPDQAWRILEKLRGCHGPDGFDYVLAGDMADGAVELEQGDDIIDTVIDDPLEAARLMEKLDGALPLNARMEPHAWRGLADELELPKGARNKMVITGLSYGGDAGGILCHLVFAGLESDNILVCSLTWLRLDGRLALAREVGAYQQRRLAALKNMQG